MENEFNTLASTTYRISYPLRASILPPIKYHERPTIQIRDQPKLLPNKPIVRDPPPQKITTDLPAAANKPRQHKPQRLPADQQRQPADPLLGLSEPLSLVAPRCADGYQQEVKEGLVDELCQSYHWKTSSKEAAKEGCLRVPELVPPRSTMEPRSDFSPYRPMRFDSHQLPWQRVAPVWDRLQERPHVGNNVSSRQIGTQTSPTQLLPTAKKAPHKKDRISLDERIKQLVRENKLSSMFVRACPGYAGYVPRSPQDVSMEASLVHDLRTVTTMKSSYRPFAVKEYTTMKYAHKGPLSRTVTLTYPYNPYNKVENRAEEIEHKW